MSKEDRKPLSPFSGSSAFGSSPGRNGSVAVEVAVRSKTKDMEVTNTVNTITTVAGTNADANANVNANSDLVDYDLLMKFHGWNNDKNSESNKLGGDSDNNNEQLTAIVKNMDIDQKTIEVIDAKEQVLDNNNEEAMEIEYDVDADEQL